MPNLTCVFLKLCTIRNHDNENQEQGDIHTPVPAEAMRPATAWQPKFNVRPPSLLRDHDVLRMQGLDVKGYDNGLLQCRPLLYRTDDCTTCKACRQLPAIDSMPHAVSETYPAAGYWILDMHKRARGNPLLATAVIQRNRVFTRQT